MGFALGGYETTATNNALEGPTSAQFPLPGMVMYNMTSQDWYNISASGYSNDGVAMRGAAQFVPSFGPAGLMFVFGGTVANGILPGTDVVSFFEPISQQWSSQEVSGSKPSPVIAPCVVGVQGDNSTYEVVNDRDFTTTKANRSTRRFSCMADMLMTPTIQSLKARSSSFPCQPSIG